MGKAAIGQPKEEEANNGTKRAKAKNIENVEAKSMTHLISPKTENVEAKNMTHLISLKTENVEAKNNLKSMKNQQDKAKAAATEELAKKMKQKKQVEKKEAKVMPRIEDKWQVFNERDFDITSD